MAQGCDGSGATNQPGARDTFGNPGETNVNTRDNSIKDRKETPELDMLIQEEIKRKVRQWNRASMTSKGTKIHQEPSPIKIHKPLTTYVVITDHTRAFR